MPLNELTAKEWAKLTRSWFVENPPPRSYVKFIHPAPFPHTIPTRFIKIFTSQNDIVLDPMCGVGSVLYACHNTGRIGFGVELYRKYVELAVDELTSLGAKVKMVDTERGEIRIFEPLTLISGKEQTIILGDARNILSYNIPPVDYIITSPPYWDILVSNLTWREDRDGDELVDERFEYYGDDERDLGNIRDYGEFLRTLIEIYRDVVSLLKPGKYMTVIIKNIRKQEKFYPLAWELALKMRDELGLRLKEEMIWCQDHVRCKAVGYPSVFYTNIHHHYCLNFQKEG